MRKTALLLLLCLSFYSCKNSSKNGGDTASAKNPGAPATFIKNTGTILGNTNPPTLFPMFIDGKWGYVDKQCKLVIKPQFAGASRFSEGLAAVQMVKAGRVGLIDEKGAVVVPPQFDLVDPFSEGYAAVFINHKWGFIDRTGKIAIPPTFDAALAFNDGAAVIGQMFNNGMAYSYINPNGEPLLDPATKFIIAQPFGEGLAPVRLLGSNIRFIDKSGKTVIPPQFLGSAQFHDGLAPVWVHANEGMRWGFIGRDGKMAITARFAAANPFFEGMAAVQVLSGKWGYVNTKGSQVIPPKFDMVGPFFNGMAQVGIEDSTKIGYIDPSGKYVCEPR
jgi:hypothetical protein